MVDHPAMGYGRKTVGLIIASLTVGVGAASAPAQPRPTAKTAAGQVLVADLNHKLVHGQDPDRAGPASQEFVARLLASLRAHGVARGGRPLAPDVVLLQEMTRETTRVVRDAFRAATGRRYRHAVRPGSDPPEGARRGTAILYLAATTEEVDRDPGSEQYIRVSCLAALCRPGDRDRAYAYTLLRERAGGVLIPALSLHLPHPGAFHEGVSREAMLAERGRITRVVVESLAGAYPDAYAGGLSVVAGDFNAARCGDGDERAGCPETAPYRYMWDAGFSDAMRSVGGEVIPGSPTGRKRIDYIWGRGAFVHNAATDLDRKSDGATYSDHSFLWALLGPRPTPPPPPVADHTVTIRILGERLRLGPRGVARLRVACPHSELSPPCTGMLRVRTRRRVAFRGKRRRVVLARAPIRISAGRTQTVRLRLARPKARIARGNRRARRVLAIARVRDALGNRATPRKPLRLVARSRR